MFRLGRRPPGCLVTASSGCFPTRERRWQYTRMSKPSEATPQCVPGPVAPDRGHRGPRAAGVVGLRQRRARRPGPTATNAVADRQWVSWAVLCPLRIAIRDRPTYGTYLAPGNPRLLGRSRW